MVKSKQIIMRHIYNMSCALLSLRIYWLVKSLVVNIFWGSAQSTGCFGKCFQWCFPGSSNGTESACNEGDLGLIPGLGTSPREGHGNPLQYSCLENSMDREPGKLVHGVTKSQTWLSDQHFLFHSMRQGILVVTLNRWQNRSYITCTGLHT